MKVFGQKIGIWYKTGGWANYIFNTLLEELHDDIERVIKNERYIEMKNGDVIRFLSMNDKHRGIKVTMSFVQMDDQVDGEIYRFINNVIRPSTVYGPVYRANEYEDLFSCKRREV